MATGCFVGNHITRVYVLPEYQKKGIGTLIMKTLETRIGETYDSVYLDASCRQPRFMKSGDFVR